MDSELAPLQPVGEIEVPGIVGPGALPPDGPEQPPLLEGITEAEYAEILNPLSSGFMAQVGVTQSMSAPPRIVNSTGNPRFGEADLARAGVGDLRSLDPNGGKTHIRNQILLPSGRTTRVAGGFAATVMRQLVNYVMQAEGNGHLLADSYQRHLVEERLLMRRGFINDFISTGAPVGTPTEDPVAAALNEVKEEAFPTVRQELKEAVAPTTPPAPLPPEELTPPPPTPTIPSKPLAETPLKWDEIEKPNLTELRTMNNRQLAASYPEWDLLKGSRKSRMVKVPNRKNRIRVYE